MTTNRPRGRLVTADLPLNGTQRWVIRRKGEVVAAVRRGLLSVEQACAQYALSSDELLAWMRSYDRFGLPGLRITKTQHYRTASHNY